MSRIAKAPIKIPVNVNVKFNKKDIFILSAKNILKYTINQAVNVQYINNQLICIPNKGYSNGWSLSGTTRSILNNMVIGITKGFTKKLQLIGIGYRAIIKGKFIILSLGFSHPINYLIPEGIYAECPSQTEIILKGYDKQLIGHVAADLRTYRRPDPYKGKGIRYYNEIVRVKETKKK